MDYYYYYNRCRNKIQEFLCKRFEILLLFSVEQ